MNIVALVKQVAALETAEFDGNAVPRVDDAALVMDDLSRRAVAQGVELAAAVGDGVCTALTIGAPSGDDTLREAIAWGWTCGVTTFGVLLSDPAFADGDTLATARTLAAAIQREGPFDLVLLGAESGDVGTGQLGPELAELLDLPFAACARYLSMQGSRLHVRCEQDDGWMQITLPLPAVVSCAADLINPCEMPPTARATVPDERIRTLTAADLGRGPWGRDASPTSIRAAYVGAMPAPSSAQQVAPSRGVAGVAVGVLAPTEHPRLARELLGAGAALAHHMDGHVVAITTKPTDTSAFGSWGADAIVTIEGSTVEEDIAHAIARWAREEKPWAVLAPSTAWAREITGRAAADLGAGLAGAVDAVELDGDRLVARKRAFGDRVVAEIIVSAPLQFATVRPGALMIPKPRAETDVVRRTISVQPRRRVRVMSRTAGTSRT